MTGTKFVAISVYPNQKGAGILKHHCVPPPEVIDEFIKTDMTKNNGYGVLAYASPPFKQCRNFTNSKTSDGNKRIQKEHTLKKVYSYFSAKPL